MASFSANHVEEALGVVISRHAAELERLVEHRTPYPRQVMVALVVDTPEHPTGTRFVTENQLRGPAFVQEAMHALQKAEMLADDGSFVDPLFAWWLRRNAVEN